MSQTISGKTSRTLAALVCASFTLATAGQAQADRALVGGLVGGLIGGAIGSAAAASRNQPQPQPQQRVIIEERRVVQPARPAISNFERAQNRSAQDALNYFGFPVGAPDGVLGPRSRGAISEFQATLGFPATGYLTEYERNFLLSSHARAQSSPLQSGQLAAQYGMGQRGILIAYHTGQVPGPMVAQQPQQVFVAQPQPVIVAQPQPYALAQQPQVVINNNAPAAQPPVTVEVNAPPAAAPAPQTQMAAATPAPTAAAAPTGMMPSFLGGPVEASMASFCNKTSLLTSGAGGMVTAASLASPAIDAGQALGEQFCLARTYAIDQGEQLTQMVQGVSLTQMQEQCAAFAPTMREFVAAMVAKGPSDATSDLSTFVINTGMNPAQLSANAKICLSIGYRSDNADVALASALVLVGLGEAAYGEMLAHHMAQGFGAPKRLDRAADWFDATGAALEGGAVRVVAPGASERPQLLRVAALRLRGGQAMAPAAPQQAVLPSFGMPVAAPATKASN